MKIYSENVLLFNQKCEGLLKQIIKEETPYKAHKSRFTFGAYTYPIHVVTFVSNSQLGYFDPHSYQVGLNQSLMYSTKELVLKNILRHELAHYICYIENQDLNIQHGEIYQKTCRRFGWENSVSKASLDIDLANSFEGDLKSEKMINKVKALLKLAESDNIHESELATMKANQLLLKHNISSLDLSQNTLYIRPVLKVARRNAKLNAIYEILKHFLVKPVFVYGQKQVTLEVSGTKENIELADYIANFLDREFERLWKAADHLKGQKAKNSFFMGIARGHDEKMNSFKESVSSEDKKALIKINTNLETAINKFYKRLSHKSSGGSIDRNAYHSGKTTGRNLNIKPGIKNKSKTFLLNWSRS